MQQVTNNVMTETLWRGCNPSFVVTSAGVVVIDTPQLPTRAVQMRRDAEQHGLIRYVINTEHHVDHVFGNFFFRGAGELVQQARLAELSMQPSPDLDPYSYAAEAVPMNDPDGAKLLPSRAEFYDAIWNADITFGDRLTFRVGGHDFELLHTPGHTPGQTAVLCPQERVLFTGDTLFVGCQTWLMTSDVYMWLEALDQLADLDVDVVVPGHGSPTTLEHLKVQRSVLFEWVSRVADVVARGWTREEAMARLRVTPDLPVDVGQEYMMEHVQTNNVGALYDQLTCDPKPSHAT